MELHTVYPWFSWRSLYRRLHYLTYKAQEVGPLQVVLKAERSTIAWASCGENTIKTMIKANRLVNRSRVAIFGITFKENCPDARNTKVIDIVRELNEYGVQTLVVDPVADGMNCAESMASIYVVKKMLTMSTQS